MNQEILDDKWHFFLKIAFITLTPLVQIYDLPLDPISLFYFFVLCFLVFFTYLFLFFSIVIFVNFVEIHKEQLHFYRFILFEFAMNKVHSSFFLFEMEDIDKFWFTKFETCLTFESPILLLN